MTAAEFIIKHKVDLYSVHGEVRDHAGNMLIEKPDFWIFLSSDGHMETVYL